MLLVQMRFAKNYLKKNSTTKREWANIQRGKGMTLKYFMQLNVPLDEMQPYFEGRIRARSVATR